MSKERDCEWLSIDEVSDEIGLSNFHLRRLISNGDLVATMKSRIWLVHKKDLQNFTQKRDANAARIAAKKEIQTMESKKYESMKLIEGFREDKMLEYMNDGYEILGMTSTSYGALKHYILIAKRSKVVTNAKKPSKVKSKIQSRTWKVYLKDETHIHKTTNGLVSMPDLQDDESWGSLRAL